jgi:Ca2+-binding RTX toxin-like protein
VAKRLLPLAVLVVFLTAVPAASAAPGPTVVTFNGGSVNRLDVIAAFDTANDITIAPQGGRFRISDTGTGATVTSPSPECDQVNATTVDCDDPGTGFGPEMDVNLKDLDDRLLVDADASREVTINAGAGDDDVQSIGQSIDTISGHLGADVMDAGPGADTIYGSNSLNLDETAGNVIRGGDGADVLYGGNGDDLYDEEAAANGNDFMSGFGGSDTVTYAARTNPVTANLDLALADPPYSVLSGEAGEGDFIQENVENAIGGPRNDRLIGGRAPNVLDGRAGADVYCGVTGFDTVDYSSRTEPLNVTIGADSGDPEDPNDGDPNLEDCEPVQGGVDEKGADDCVANDGGATDLDPATGRRDCIAGTIENIIGGSGDDVMVGNDPRVSPIGEPRGEVLGKNFFQGGAGNDTFDGGLGADTFDGEAGVDTVSYASRTSSVNATLDGSADDGNAALDTELNPDVEAPKRENIMPSVENVIGGAGADNIVGSDDAANVLEGRSGDDTINGGGGGDSILGGIGDDDLEGEAGNDSLQGLEGDDTVDGGEGNDDVNGGADNDVLLGGTGGDDLIGGDGVDLADYSASMVPLYVNAANGVADDGAAGEGDNVRADIENLSGGLDNDTLIGGPSDGILSGGAGDDGLDGGGGADVLLGGEGSDNASYAARIAPVTVDLAVPGGDGEAGENDNIASDVEKVTGGAAGDTITGDANGNVLTGLGGDDTLNGGDAFDQLLGGPGNDALNGDGGDDFLKGEWGNDALNGGEGADKVEGGAGDDMLDGGPGADTLAGETGSDTASYGFRSADVFVTLDGAADDGQAGENDFIRTDVRNVRTGSGDDTINSRDGRVGKIFCGGGSDVVDADTDDDADSSCEVVNRVGASSRCSVSGSSATVQGSNVSLRVRCPMRAAGTLVLETAGAVRAVNDAKRKARKLRLGSKRFSISRSGQRKTVKVKLSRKGKRLLNRRKRLRVRALLRFKPTGVTKAATRRASRVVTLKKRGGK